MLSLDYAFCTYVALLGDQIKIYKYMVKHFLNSLL